MSDIYQAYVSVTQAQRPVNAHEVTGDEEAQHILTIEVQWNGGGMVVALQRADWSAMIADPFKSVPCSVRLANIFGSAA